MLFSPTMSSRRFLPFWFLGLAALLAPISGACSQLTLKGGESAIYTGSYNELTEQYENLAFLNSVVGWDTLINAGYAGSGRIIANVEAGLVWDGHEAFHRPPGSPAAVGLTLSGTGALAEADFHATMVGHVLAGTGYVAPPSEGYTYAGLGMAPFAEIWSGAIATAYSPTETGSFETSTESTVSVYRAFFQGIGGLKPDVINSSWGGSDPGAGSVEMLAIDGLARQNSTVAFVASAGNGGSAPVSAPGSTFNSITVGSLGGASFLQPSSFSSSGAVDFFNPVTGQTLTGVRAAVDIAAPGEDLILAAYLGDSGAFGASTDPDIMAAVQVTPTPTDRYFRPQSGTSFSAPIVAGGIALLKDAAANDFLFNLNGIPDASDTRVIKSVLMAGATETVGWNNGQALNGAGVITTTQSLDYQTGAGALDLNRAFDIYLLSGTRDVAGTNGGAISDKGWDFAAVGLAGHNDYRFKNPFDTVIELTVSLSWFAGRSFDNTLGIGEDLSFADLNLEVWQVLNGAFSTLLAQSTSVYNNAEFLRVDLPAGTYGLRITFNGLVYETLGANVTNESYGVAWRSQAVPEPATIVLFLIGAGFLMLRVARRRNFF